MPDLSTPSKYSYQHLYNQLQKTKAPKRENIYGAIITCSRTGRFLLVLGREAMKWSFPKGHAHESESAFSCLIREVYEETGFIDLPPPMRRRPLKVGEYYEFIVPEEFIIRPIDTNEIVEGKWMSLHEIRMIMMNLDTSYYFRELGITPFETNVTIEDSCIGGLINMISEEESSEPCNSQSTEDPC